MLKFLFSFSLGAVGWHSHYGNYVMECKFQQGKEGFLFSKSPHQPLVLPSLLFNGYLASFPVVKWVGHEVDHSHPSNAKVKNEWSCTSAPPICLHLWMVATLPFFWFDGNN